jgi:hypothetical protein
MTGSVAGLLSLAVLERAPQRFQRGYEAAQAEPEIGALRLAKIP